MSSLSRPTVIWTAVVWLATRVKRLAEEAVESVKWFVEENRCRHLIWSSEVSLDVRFEVCVEQMANSAALYILA